MVARSTWSQPMNGAAYLILGIALTMGAIWMVPVLDRVLGRSRHRRSRS